MAAKKVETAKADDFKSVARRLECDEDKERFESALSKIAHAKSKLKRRSRQKRIRVKTATSR